MCVVWVYGFQNLIYIILLNPYNVIEVAIFRLFVVVAFDTKSLVSNIFSMLILVLSWFFHPNNTALVHTLQISLRIKHYSVCKDSYAAAK